MGRTIDDIGAATYANLVSGVTSPGYLVEISGPGVTYRLSSRGEVSHDGATWYPAALRLQRLNPDRGTATVQIGNRDLGIGAIILTGVVDWSVVIRLYDQPRDHSVLIVSGVIDEAEVDRDWGTLAVVPSGASYRTAPRVRFHRHLFAALPAAGTVIRWENTEYTVEAGNG